HQGQELVPAELVGDGGVDAGRDDGPAREVAPRGGEHGSVGVGDGVHGEAIEDAAAVHVIGQITDARTEADVRVGYDDGREGPGVGVEGGVDPATDLRGVGVVGGRGLDDARAFVPGVGP